MILSGMNEPTAGLLQAGRDGELLDAADLLFIAWLLDRAGDADPDATAIGIAALCRACAEGGLCLPLEERDLGDLRDFLSAAGLPVETVPDGDALAARFLADAEAGRLAAVLGSPDVPRPLIRGYGNLYFHRHWNAQREIAAALRERARMDPDAGSAARDARIPDVLREILIDNPLRSGGRGLAPLALAKRQKWALVAALRERVFVLSGGPGTGKTTWTASWLRALLRLPGVTPDRVRLCAPTGRAAQRLRESLRASLEGAARTGDAADAAARDLPVTTLHTLLGYQPYTGRFARSPEDPLDVDWVLVDEASMVDVFLLATLVRALPGGARLILVGDADQLPPVEAGSALGELLPDDRLPRLSPAARAAIAAVFPDDAPADPDAGAAGTAPSVMLDVGHRASDAIAPLIAALRAGDPDGTVAALGEPLGPAAAFAPGLRLARMVPGHDAGSIPEVLRAFADAAFLRRREEGGTFAAWLGDFRKAHRDDEPRIVQRLWKFAAAARVLAPLRRGPASAERANRLLRELLEPRWRLPGDARGTGFHGAPILITRNDARTGLSNGDLGLWLEAAGGAAAFFPGPDLPGGWLRLPVALLPAHELGFASTVHKSQGSECDEVLILLPEPGNRLLARETLYTAVTRARSAVRIFGTEAAIREAVERKMRRHGGLREMLRGGWQGR